MVTIGVDAHKGVHAAVALDGAGQPLGHWRGPNSRAGWQALREWAVSLRSGAARQWGIEGAWNHGRGLAQHLVDVGEAVYEVNPGWTAEGRRRARTPGKSDALDARAVARLVPGEAPRLPRVGADDGTAVLDLLVAERAGAVAEATRLRTQLHQLLLQVDPEYRAHLPSLRTAAGVAALAQYAAPGPRPLDQERAAAVRRLAQRLRVALDQAEDLAAQIRPRAQARCAFLTGRCGVSLLTAGALAGILGPGHRFRTDAQFAAYAGVAPLEASSAGRVRHRLNRGGNRRLHAILHRIAAVQARSFPAARAYLARRTAEGKTHREAMRAPKRLLARAIWRLWQDGTSAPSAPCTPPAGPPPDRLTTEERQSRTRTSALRGLSPSLTGRTMKRCRNTRRGTGRPRYADGPSPETNSWYGSPTAVATSRSVTPVPIEMIIRGLGQAGASGAPLVLLKEAAGERHLVIGIGPLEALGIAAALSGSPPPRPMTHDLLCSAIAACGARVTNAVIHALVNDAFHARLTLDVQGRLTELDSRSSDAIAVAVRIGLPILVEDAVLERAGFTPQAEADAADAPAGPAGQERIAEEKLGAFRDVIRGLDLDDLGRPGPAT